MLEYLDFVDDVLDELDSRKEVEYIRTMLERGNGAERQLEVFDETQRPQESRRIHGRGDAGGTVEAIESRDQSHPRVQLRRC